MAALSSLKLAGRAGAFYPLVMAGKSGKPSDPRRAERLKAALRDNLKRRKAQERARAGAAKEHDSAGISCEIAHPKPKG